MKKCPAKESARIDKLRLELLESISRLLKRKALVVTESEFPCDVLTINDVLDLVVEGGSFCIQTPCLIRFDLISTLRKRIRLFEKGVITFSELISEVKEDCQQFTEHLALVDDDQIAKGFPEEWQRLIELLQVKEHEYLPEGYYEFRAKATIDQLEELAQQATELALQHPCELLEECHWLSAAIESLAASGIVIAFDYEQPQVQCETMLRLMAGRRLSIVNFRAKDVKSIAKLRRSIRSWKKGRITCDSLCRDVTKVKASLSNLSKPWKARFQELWTDLAILAFGKVPGLTRSDLVMKEAKWRDRVDLDRRIEELDHHLTLILPNSR